LAIFGEATVMNVRFVMIVTVILAGPSLFSMVQGRLDPDAALIRLMLAVAFATFADAAIRGFVTLTGSEPQTQPARSAQHAPAEDEHP
jgi:hypothetical protein